MVCALACVWLKHLHPLVNNYRFMLCHSPESPANFLKAVGNKITLYLWISLVVLCTVNTVNLKSPLQSKICFSSLSYSWMFELHYVEYMCRVWTLSEPLHDLGLSHHNIFSETSQTRSSSTPVWSYPVLQRQLHPVYQRDERMVRSSVLTALETLCFGGDGKENSGGPYFSGGPLITQKRIMDILSFVPS